MKKKRNLISLRILLVLFLIIFTATSNASYRDIGNKKYFELGFAKSEVLQTSLYIPNVTIGGFIYKKLIPFQITMGFLSEDVSRQDSGKLQELNDFFYIGPQYIKKYQLFSSFYTELGLAVLTGNLNSKSTQVNSSSYREGMFLGIQPKIKLLVNLSKSLNLVFDFHYILTSSNLDNEAAEIGPSFGVGLRYDLDFSLR